MRLTDREIATICASLRAWLDELTEGEEWIREIYGFERHAPLSEDEVCDLRSRLERADEVVSSTHRPETWELFVPTYVGGQNARSNDQSPLPDFADPHVPVLISESNGVRLVLGTHDYEDRCKPDVQIERRPHGWAIFLHPDAGDLVACVYILDDRRTFLLPERYMATPISIVDDIPADLDHP